MNIKNKLIWLKFWKLDYQKCIFFQTCCSSAKVYSFPKGKGNNQRKSDRDIEDQSFEFELSS